MVGVGDLRDVIVGELAMHAIDERAELARVDEERLLLAVAHLLASTAEAVLLSRAKNHRQTGICVE